MISMIFVNVFMLLGNPYKKSQQLLAIMRSDSKARDFFN